MGRASNTQPYILHAGEHLSGEDPGVKASAESTCGAISLIDSVTTGGAPWHMHRNEDECFYVVEGEISIHTSGQTWRAGRGSFVFLPRGVPHAWGVIGDEARVLIINTPAGFEQFLSEYHNAPASQRDSVAERYGITFLHEREP